MEDEIKDRINRLERKLGLNFSDQNLLRRALTHKSYVNERGQKKLKDNERLEFLGDSVLDLIVSRHIFVNYPNHPEGELAKIRSVVVSAPILAEVAGKLELGKYMLLGKGEELTGGRERNSILADCLEAVVGAIYLDRGLELAREFILDLLSSQIETVECGEYIRDYKTMLQELIQQDSDFRPEYEVVAEKGPDHNKKFTVEVTLDGKTIGIGKGDSKKKAEQKAAKEAINEVE